MKHHYLNEVCRRADIQGEGISVGKLSRGQKLARWEKILRDQGDRRLSTLEGTEFARPDRQAAMRAEQSPLSVAYKDPVLRSAGLANDTYGEAKRFFELTDRQLHHVVCHCHCGARISARLAADRVQLWVPASSWLGSARKAIARWFVD